jgi:hypothetical protein
MAQPAMDVGETRCNVGRWDVSCVDGVAMAGFGLAVLNLRRTKYTVAFREFMHIRIDFQSYCDVSVLP